MNKARRRELDDIINRLTAVTETLDDIHTDLSDIYNEESDYYDNMPESLQDGDRGERALNSLAMLEEALSQIEDLNTTINEDIIPQINEAKE